MSKVIDLSKTVHDICKEDPEVVEILKNLGFDQITSPVMLNTAGRVMTLPKGAGMKGIALDKIINEFEKRGYSVKPDTDGKVKGTLYE